MTKTFIARERYEEVIVEALPLLRAHYEEIAWRRDKIPLDIDHDLYKRMDATGLLRVHTARRDGRLVGYAAWTIQPQMAHYKTTKIARNDVIYCEPQARGAFVGSRLLKFAEDEFRGEGVHMMTLHIKEKLNWGALARHCGYEPVEASWWKWIGEENGS